LLVVFLAERVSADWTVLFLIRFAGGEFGGLFSGIGEAFWWKPLFWPHSDYAGTTG
jgi:hypothetical protein